MSMIFNPATGEWEDKPDGAISQAVATPVVNSTIQANDLAPITPAAPVATPAFDPKALGLNPIMQGQKDAGDANDGGYAGDLVGWNKPEEGKAGWTHQYDLQGKDMGVTKDAGLWDATGQIIKTVVLPALGGVALNSMGAFGGVEGVMANGAFLGEAPWAATGALSSPVAGATAIGTELAPLGAEGAVNGAFLGEAPFSLVPEGAQTAANALLTPMTSTSPVDYGFSGFQGGEGLHVGAGNGLGLQIPTSPGLTPMGGAQGLTVGTVDGGVVSALGYAPVGSSPILGDPSSFINDPNILGNTVIGTDTLLSPGAAGAGSSLLDKLKKLTSPSTGGKGTTTYNESPHLADPGYVKLDWSWLAAAYKAALEDAQRGA